MSAQWFCLQVFSGYEFKVEEALHRNARLAKVEERIKQIAIPVEDVITTASNGDRRTKKKSFMPGYMFLRAEIDAALLRVVQETNYIVGFVETKRGTLPKPLSKHDMKRILERIGTTVDTDKPQTDCKVGDDVVIIDGPFKDFSGQVVRLDDDKIQVMVSVFGRITPVTLALFQVKKELK